MALAFILAACGSDDDGAAATSSTNGTTALPSQVSDGETDGYSIEAEWGTFMLSSEIQQQVQSKLEAGEPLDLPVFIWITGDEFFVPVRAGIEDAAEDLGVTSQLLGPVEANQPQMIS